MLATRRDYYAKTHHLSAEEVEKLDPAIVLGTFYFHEWQISSQEVAKLRGQPYPVLLARTAALRDTLAALRKAHRANPFWAFVEDLHKPIWSVARTDRQIAALTTVEAIRAYAAANNNSLPKQLSDVTATP